MDDLLVVVLGYLMGSIPFAYLLSRRRGIDLRVVGSGNVGAANVLRTSGVPTAVAAMVLDALKGSLAVLAAAPISLAPATLVAAGLASVIGHMYPVWLGFKGGKGVATAAGVFGVLAPAALGIASAVFVLVVVTTRYVSVGSLAGAVTLAVVATASGGHRTVAAGAILTALIIIYRHRGNLSRLIAGTERRVGQRV